MDKKRGFLISLICFLTGVIVGFIISPVKQGMGNNCGNSYHYNKDGQEDSGEKKEDATC
jgi:hypothetical protein